MTKTEALDEVIEMLIKKAMEDDLNKQKNDTNHNNQKLRGDKKNGVYSTGYYRKQA